MKGNEKCLSYHRVLYIPRYDDNKTHIIYLKTTWMYSYVKNMYLL